METMGKMRNKNPRTLPATRSENPTSCWLTHGPTRARAFSRRSALARQKEFPRILHRITFTHPTPPYRISVIVRMTDAQKGTFGVKVRRRIPSSLHAHSAQPPPLW